MSGHSKWSTIKRKKGALDAKRSKIFSKIVKEIYIAVRDGGSDENNNPSLRLAINNAKGVNMPKDNVQRAVNKADSGGENFEEMTFEGYGQGGVAIFVECLSDNNLRTVSSVRAVFNKRNGSLGKNGSLSFLFDRKGVFQIPKRELDPEEFEFEIIDAGLEELEIEDDNFVIYTAIEDFGNMSKKLEKMEIKVENAELQRIPNSTKKVSIENAKSNMRLIEAFEENDDVQNVYHNMELTPEIEDLLNEE
ncbi:MAG: YebC/PmpR family DNA-binding transcriptional regulator [Bacteroidetes bacterium 4572_128]|nr:MAG: YebC/PmpR family DNA-binding transcriptional regulator [Bacteroidetes bacterium 4572_128]